MELLIVRHGEALPIDKQKIRKDTDRTLTSKGRKNTAQTAKVLNKMACKPQLILTSPLVRARQTAEILSKHLQTKAKTKETDSLKPGAPPDQILKELNDVREPSIIITGHSPDLDHLASLLVSGDKSAKIQLKKSSLCVISFENKIIPGQGTLEWLLQPFQINRITKK
jgi:phosphohistidine phosphatase